MQNFPVSYNPMHKQSGQIQDGHVQAGQSQPAQINFVPWHPRPNHLMAPSDLAMRLGIPNVLPQDMQHLNEVGRHRVLERQRACAEQLARSSKFADWLRSPTSSRLLVHENNSKVSKISGLSLFCVSLEKVLATHSGCFIPLAFFCGLHAELPDDPDSSGESNDDYDESGASRSEPQNAARNHDPQTPWLSPGSAGLMQSLIYQLLEKHYHLNGEYLTVTPQEIDGIENRKLGALYEVFRRLVYMLPESVTVWLMVDGAVYYERDEFVDDMQRVMLPLLQLSEPGVTRARLKVLVTSPTNMSDIQEWFAEDSILSMTELGRPAQVTNEQGLQNMLASALMGAERSSGEPGPFGSERLDDERIEMA